MIEPIEGRSVWRGSNRDKRDFYLELNAEEHAAVDAALARIDTEGLPLEQIDREHFSDPRLEALTARLVDEVMNGRGLVVLGRLPVDGYDEATIGKLFWGLCRHLGNPVSQSVLGDRLGHVIDESAADPHARGYRHHMELTPHTDFQDVVAFLCMQPSSVGGASWFASAPAVHNELLATRPDLLEVLYRGYHTHRFGEQGQGEAPITEHRIPVFSSCQGVVSCRFLRFYIEIAAREGTRLDALEREALDAFDAASMSPDIGVGFRLERGEAAIMNNYAVLHGRTEFEDDPDTKRHLLRLWMATGGARPILPEVALFASERAGRGVEPQPDRLPSYDTHGTVDRVYGNRMPQV